MTITTRLKLQYKRILYFWQKQFAKYDFSSIRNTKWLIIITIAFVVIFSLTVDVVVRPEGNLINQIISPEPPNTAIESQEQISYAARNNIEWDSKIESGTEIGNKLITTDFYSIYYSTIFNKYVVRIEAGEFSNILSIENWLFEEELPKYKEFSEGIDHSKIKIIDDRNDYYRENELDKPYAPADDIEN